MPDTQMHGMKAPTATSATEENFQRLTDNLDTLYEAIDKLQGRIDPILVDSTPSMSEDKRAGYSSPTGVSQRLATLCSRTDDLIDRVKYLTARIDL